MLDQTYDRILSAISEDDAEYAVRILQWLTFSARPLSIDAIAEVVAIDVERDPAFERDEVLEDPSEVLTASCLRCLLQLQFLKLNPEALEMFKLARYSAEFWTSHAQETNETRTEIKDWAIRLCCKENPAYINWIRLWDPDQPWQKPDFQKDLKQISDPLYYTARLGLGDVVKLLLEKGADPNAQGGRYGNALQAASLGGHEMVVKLLLEKGADPNAQGGCYDNALQAASEGGHETV
ncbi:ankyrin, partial [Polyplosphaeria fusca]